MKTAKQWIQKEIVDNTSSPILASLFQWSNESGDYKHCFLNALHNNNRNSEKYEKRRCRLWEWRFGRERGLGPDSVTVRWDCRSPLLFWQGLLSLSLAHRSFLPTLLALCENTFVWSHLRYGHGILCFCHENDVILCKTCTKYLKRCRGYPGWVNWRRCWDGLGFQEWLKRYRLLCKAVPGKMDIYITFEIVCLAVCLWHLWLGCVIEVL